MFYSKLPEGKCALKDDDEVDLDSSFSKLLDSFGDQGQVTQGQFALEDGVADDADEEEEEEEEDASDDDEELKPAKFGMSVAKSKKALGRGGHHGKRVRGDGNYADGLEEGDIVRISAPWYTYF